MARSTSNSKRRRDRSFLMTRWQPVCCQSRPKMRAGPMWVVLITGSCPLAWRGKQEDRLGQSSPRGQQSVELTAFLELVEPPQSGNDPLPGTTILPTVLDDLKVRAACRTSWYGRTWCPRSRATMIIGILSAISRPKISETWHHENRSTAIASPSQKDLRRILRNYCLKPALQWALVRRDLPPRDSECNEPS